MSFIKRNGMMTLLKTKSVSFKSSYLQNTKPITYVRPPFFSRNSMREQRRQHPAISRQFNSKTKQFIELVKINRKQDGTCKLGAQLTRIKSKPNFVQSTAGCLHFSC